MSHAIAHGISLVPQVYNVNPEDRLGRLLNTASKFLLG